MQQQKRKKKKKIGPQLIISPKNSRNVERTISKKRKSSLQKGDFLNRYDFAYAGRDVVNQAGKVAPKIISQATGEIIKIAEDRIGQIVKGGGAEIERVAPKIIRGAIEDVCKTPFRVLGKFGKEQFEKIKRKILK